MARSYPQSKNPEDANKIGWLTTKVCHFSTKRGRDIAGLESMYLMGFPRSLRYQNEAGGQKISDNELRMLAGNSIYVPMLAVLCLTILCKVDFSRSHGSPPGPHHNQYGKMIDLGSDGSGSGKRKREGAANDQNQFNKFNQLPGVSDYMAAKEKRRLKATHELFGNSALC